MAAKALPSPEVLRQLLRYEPDTGKLFWLRRAEEWFSSSKYSPSRAAKAWNAKHAETEAFTADDGAGYRSGRVLGWTGRAHRAIWAMESGDWPAAEIDHADGDPSNNRWSNLRLATRAENIRNTRNYSGSSSQYRGVWWDKRYRKWHVNIKVDQKKLFLGRFENEVDAAMAYDSAAREHFGEFARPNLQGEIP